MAPFRRAAPTPTPTRDHDFVSQPTPLDVLVTYLVPRVLFNDRSARFIHDADVYGSDPESLTTSYGPAVAADGSKSWYFFTDLKAAKNGGSRKERRALNSSWSWHQDHRTPPLQLEGERIGYYLSLAYSRKVEKAGNKRIRSGWLMQEFRLLERPEDSTHQHPHVALCRIYHTPRQESAAVAVLEPIHSSPTAAITKPIQSACQESAAVAVLEPIQSAPSATITKPIQSACQESAAVAVLEPTQSASAAAITQPIQSVTPSTASITKAPVCGMVEVCHPCDLHLINQFLVPRVNFKVLIHNAGLYDSDPAQISCQFAPTVSSDGQEAWYFFTDRYLEAGVRVVATGGYWESRYSAREILDDKREKVGEHQLFQFFKSDETTQEGERDYVCTGWNMIELSTDSEAAVLCKLYRTTIGALSRKRTRVDSVVAGCLSIKKPKEVAVAAFTMAI